MSQVICSDKPRVNNVNMQKVDSADKNRSEEMKLYDLNRLDDKYISSVLIRSCHDNKNISNGDAESYKLWKSHTDFLSDLFPLGFFDYLTPLTFMNFRIIVLLKLTLL